MTAAIFLADGFEETEAITVADILRRAEINLKIIGVESDLITGAHGITVKTDLNDKNFKLDDNMKMIIFPGGMKGTLNLQQSKFIKSVIDFALEKNIYISAICAAPIILGQLGILNGKEAVCYPGLEKKLLGAKICNEPVCLDDKFITANGLGVSIDFALKLVEVLIGEYKANRIKNDILIN